MAKSATPASWIIGGVVGEGRDNSAPGTTEDDRARLGSVRRGAEYDRLIAAEMALKACLLPRQFKPGAIGLLHDRGAGWRVQGGRRVV